MIGSGFALDFCPGHPRFHVPGPTGRGRSCIPVTRVVVEMAYSRLAEGLVPGMVPATGMVRLERL